VSAAPERMAGEQFRHDLGHHPECALRDSWRDRVPAVLSEEEREQDHEMDVALHPAFLPVLHPRGGRGGTGADAGDADAAEDRMLYFDDRPFSQVCGSGQ